MNRYWWWFRRTWFGPSGPSLWLFFMGPLIANWDKPTNRIVAAALLLFLPPLLRMMWKIDRPDVNRERNGESECEKPSVSR